APCAIKLSMSVNCFCGEDCASAEMYLSPAAAIAAFIAASSVFQRSSWKFDQETPMTLPLACARPVTQNDNDNTAPASTAAANFVIRALPVSGPRCRVAVVRLFRSRRYCVSLRFAYWLSLPAGRVKGGVRGLGHLARHFPQALPHGIVG